MGAPSSKMSSKRVPKWVPNEYPSPVEQLLNRLFVKRLQYRIRPCLPMFAAHLVACKINIFVIRGCNIGANMAPSAHAENGVTFKIKVFKMRSKCGPEGVPKTDKRQYQTVISDFGRALVRVLSPPPWSWILTAAWGAGCRPKGVQTGWSIRLEWHTGVTCEVFLAHRSASSTQRPWNHPLQA